jgi:muramoyltetrapeptide carboxypeptidase
MFSLARASPRPLEKHRQRRGSARVLGDSDDRRAHQGPLSVAESCLLIDHAREPSDGFRAADINTAFADDSVAGVIALKAGSGTLSILPHLDYDLIRRNPKIVLGYSDVTALHLALNAFCEMVSFHGPLATTNMFVETSSGRALEPYTAGSLHKALFSAHPLGRFTNASPPAQRVESW